MLARNRLLKAALLLVALLPFQGISAQGLGELTLESSLNEPLRATIDLIDVTGLNASQIAISVASAEEYEQYGLDRESIVSDINFSVELFPLGRGQVTLTTEERVTEPFLSLLISARWPSGRVLRDYTLLIDLPTFSDGTEPQQIEPAETLADQPANQPAAGSQRTYTVASGDSLWEIAEQTRPDTDISVQQMMIAIQRANEDAFVNNNVNRLLNGRVLRIPTRREITIIEHSAAIAQINAQNEALGLMRVVGDTAVPARTTERDELSVLTEEDAEAPGDGEDLAATIAALENELMLTEEDLDRVRLENIELRAQLEELEQQIDILKNLIAFEDERIARLQAELAEQAEATENALEEAGKAAQVLQAAQQQQTQPQGMVDRIIAMLENNLVMLGAVFFVVLLVLGFLFYRVRAARAGLDDDDDMDLPRERDDSVPRGASRVEDDEESAAGPGLLARLLAMFRRGEKDEDDTEEAVPAAAAAPEPAPAPEPLPEPEVDEIEEDDDEVDFSELDSMLEDDEEDDAELLAGSLMDEVQESMQDDDSDVSQLSAYDEPEYGEAGTEEQRASDAETAGQEGDTAAEETAEEEAAKSGETPEAFEFSLDDVPQPEIEIPEPEGEIESFEFNLDNANAPPGTGNNNAGLDLSLGDSKAEDEVDFDLGNLSFNEQDAAEAARKAEESENAEDNEMDECDTKLDLAVAYEAMGDVEGAVEILEEVISEGKPAQIEEAQRLKEKWQND